MEQSDLEFLEHFRAAVDRYLILGYAPAGTGPGGRDPDGIEMDEATRSNPMFAELRRQISQGTPRVKEILKRFGIAPILSQALPAAVGGGIISRQHLMDMIIDNQTWRQIPKEKFLDILDQGIGALKYPAGRVRSESQELQSSAQGRVFISHGGESFARHKTEAFLRDLGLLPIIAEREPSESRDINPDTIEKLTSCSAVIILATGDDNTREGKRQPRGNVISETRLAEERLPGRIIYLLEEGASFPSLHASKALESFTHDNMERAFGKIVRELRAFGIIG